MNEDKFKDLLEKIEKLKKGAKFDLSLDEDLSLALMNLVSLEEHFFFTAEKTKKSDYFDLLNQIRQIRKELLAKLVPAHEGETWCISKHLLAAAMRLIEVGTKLYQEDKKAQAKEIFDRAYKIYALFWALRLKLIDLAGVKKIQDNKLDIHDEAGIKKGWSVEEIVNKLVNCCDE